MILEQISINTHSSIRITGTKTIYFDPFQIADETHDADVIFVTHEHYDHFEPESISKLMNEDTVIVAPLSMKDKALDAALVPEERWYFVEPGEGFTLFNMNIRVIPAYNKKSKIFHTRERNWVGYLVTLDDVTYFVAGDTDPNSENEKVRCDVALLPIGGLYTMNWREAAKLTGEIHPKVVIPTHYGTIAGSPEDGAVFEKYIVTKMPDVQVVLKLAF